MAQLWQPHRVDLKATAAPIHCQSIQTVWNPDGWQVKSARCLRAVAFYASAHVGFTMTREERMAGRVHTLLLTRKTVGPGYFAAFVLDPDGNTVDAAWRSP
jgi:hypothetical protein